jgi:prolyl oligopeptidase
MQVACSRNHALLVVSGDRATELLAVNVHTGALRSVVRAKAGTAAHAVAVDVTDEACADEFWVQTSGPVTPPTLTRVDLSRETRRWLVDESPPTFRHQDFVVRFAHTQAGPGGPVKYVVVAPANMPLDGENPTVLSGYGGFNFPERLDYLDLTGPTWLDRPGQDGRRSVFVFAYVGTTPAPEVPPWERLARSVDRFLAVAEQLCRDGVTRPSRLGALGESHGGLLVANAMVTRPRAFGAVACRSAVLDLLRYTELDGTAWTGEYGDPRDPSSRSALRGVSPCHRVAAGENYPPVLLSASSTDDRVSPAHSRKMTARLRAAGGTALYLESADGGHDGLGTTPAGARGLALTAAFFRRHLV